MLKVNDDVDLKELKKFGFKECERGYYCSLVSNNVELQVRKKERTLLLSINYDEYLDEELDIFFNLIQAGLVEKV